MKLFSRDENLSLDIRTFYLTKTLSLVGKSEEKYILIDFDVEGENDLKLRGEYLKVSCNT